MITRRMFGRTLVALPLIGAVAPPRPRKYPSEKPTGYVYRIPGFERYLEFPDGACYPASRVLADPWFGFAWHDCWFTGRRPGEDRVRLQTVDRPTGGRPLVGVLPPEEIRRRGMREYLWNIPEEFRRATYDGKRDMIELCPLSTLLAAIYGIPVIFDDDVLTPLFTPWHRPYNFPGL
jgi:hypothetical protein